MKSQNEMNKDWLVEYDSNVGKCVILTLPVRVVPGLRKPYQYTATREALEELKADLKGLLRPFKAALQCDLVDFKGLALGRRVHLFLLGYRPGLITPANSVNGDTTGITAEQWEQCTGRIKARLRVEFGEEISMYVEPWEAERKFQARFETYVKYV